MPLGYIPEHIAWFLGDSVMLTTIEGEPQPDLEISSTLIRSDSPEEAYQKAMKLGQARNLAYTNSDGKTVTQTFVGLSDLNVIHDPIEDGAEISFSFWKDVTADKIRSIVSEKEDLGVFAPITPLC